MRAASSIWRRPRRIVSRNGMGAVASALGSGMNYGVVALAVSGGALYAGGVFTTAGGTAANCIAQWNGAVGRRSVQGFQVAMRRPLCICPGGVRQHVVCGRRFHDGGWREPGQLLSLDGTGSFGRPCGSGISGMGDDGEGPYISALAVSGGTGAGGDFARQQRRRGRQLHHAMEREQLVGAGSGCGRRSERQPL